MLIPTLDIWYDEQVIKPILKGVEEFAEHDNNRGLKKMLIW